MEQGLTFQEIFEAIKKRVWFVLLATLLVSVVVVLGFKFLINPRVSSYELSFSYTFWDSENMQYPDGSPFYPRDLLLEENLERAKQKDPSFSGIDVEDMAQKDGIVVERLSDRTTERPEEAQNVLILSARSSYFRSAKQATAFLRAVAQIPVEISRERIESLNYLIDYAVFDSAYFEDRLNFLSAQRDSVLNRYNELISSYREEYSIDGKTLKNYRTEAEAVFGPEVKAELSQELSRYGLVPKEVLSTRQEELTADKKANSEKIEELKAILNSVSSSGAVEMDSVSAMLAELMVQNIDIDRKLAALNEENVEAFEARIQSEYEKLSKIASTLSSVAKSVFDRESRSIFSTSVASSEGGTPVWLVGAAALILSFILFALLAVALNRKKPKVAERKEILKETEDESKG